MVKFKIGDTVVLQGRLARIVWFSENPNEIEAMDEYIVEFEDKQRQFVVSSDLQAEQSQPVDDRDRDGDPCQRQTH